jgi:hypothetical protein
LNFEAFQKFSFDLGLAERRNIFKSEAGETIE